MKGIIFTFMLITAYANFAMGALRTNESNLRTSSQSNDVRAIQPVVARTANTSRGKTTHNIASRTGNTRTINIVQRQNKSRIGKTRGAITESATRIMRRPQTGSTKNVIARSTLTPNTNVATNSFGSTYSECRDAYFTCMDQFCALQNETYRRCICSSKIDAIKSRERALGQAATQIQDFKDLNLESILKTQSEVKAMLSETEGEKTAANARDKSQSQTKLTAISDVLYKKRTTPTSTNGQLDIAGDIKQIWNTTDLVSGSTIADLTGRALYDAVRPQCLELVADRCPSQNIMDVVATSYGMYIENDCAVLLANLDTQVNAANSTIRDTNREMAMARLENYDAHNAESINDCIAAVRLNITADTACGENYVHCLDTSGQYLERATGQPIYSERFYNLANQISLSGDILTNSQNVAFVSELNSKKDYAKNSLETCRDISNGVWEEFLRQAIGEIYQEQQSRVRQVKDECMDVVNKCYNTTVSQLRDYSNIEEQMLLGDRLILAEEMCAEKLTTCSNLYGGGSAGLALLVEEMQQITEQKIEKNCLVTLQNYVKELCRTPSADLHGYPYGCRTYTPGLMNNPQEAGTLYAKVSNYAKQYCTRPSSDGTEAELSLSVLGNVNTVINSVRQDMSYMLSAECEKLGGKWLTTFTEEDNFNLSFDYFYRETAANTAWGLCIEATTTTQGDEGDEGE